MMRFIDIKFFQKIVHLYDFISKKPKKIRVTMTIQTLLKIIITHAKLLEFLFGRLMLLSSFSLVSHVPLT